MSLSIGISFSKPIDETYKKMEKVWNACAEANVPIPDEVAEFFNYRTPDGKPQWYCCGRAIKQEDYNCKIIDITKLPKGTTLIKVCGTQYVE